MAVTWLCTHLLHQFFNYLHNNYKSIFPVSDSKCHICEGYNDDDIY